MNFAPSAIVKFVHPSLSVKNALLTISSITMTKAVIFVILIIVMHVTQLQPVQDAMMDTTSLILKLVQLAQQDAKLVTVLANAPIASTATSWMIPTYASHAELITAWNA